jgi:transposase
VPSDAPPQELADAVRRSPRVERYEHVRQLHRQGKSIRQIAKELKLSRGSVRRYLRAARCPDWKSGRPRPTQLDGFQDQIDRRLEEGCQNAAALHRELLQQGCRASASAVRRFVNRRLAALGQRRERANAAPVKPPAPPSLRQLSFAFLRRAEERTAEEQARLQALGGIDSELSEGLDLVAQFAAMTRKEQTVTLVDWLVQAEQALCPEIRGFAEGVRQDEAAVAAALGEKWSNGPVEGQVNRLKVIKRQMYGRASFRLLRARVRHAG